MHGVIHAMKLEINASLRMHNFEIGLIIYLVLYIRILNQEITNLKNLRVYFCLLLSPNHEKTDTDAITLQKLRNFRKITLGNKDRCWRGFPHVDGEN